MEELEGEPLEVSITDVVKKFNPGENVRIVGGDSAGESGTVLKHDGNKVIVALDQNYREINVKPSDIRLKTDLDRSSYNPSNLLLNKESGKYKATDLISYNANKSTGFVLQVQEDCLRVLSERNQLENVKFQEITKLIPYDRKASVQDLEGNEITNDIPVKCIRGDFKDKIGIVKRIYKKYVFMWHKDFKTSNGYFVEQTKNLKLQGSEFLKRSGGRMAGGSNRRQVDELVGKVVIITGGEFKSQRGIAKQADDLKVMVEMQTKCRTLPIDRKLVQLASNIGKMEQSNGGAGNMSIYQRDNNQAQGQATPAYGGGQSYYPQSEHWGGGASTYERPGSTHEWGGTKREY